MWKYANSINDWSEKMKSVEMVLKNRFSNLSPTYRSEVGKKVICSIIKLVFE